MQTPSEAQLALPAILDLTTAPGLRQACLERMGEHDLVLDATALARITTPGLQVMLAAARDLAGMGHALVVANASEALTRAVEELGLADMLATGSNG